jgi:hypothetical protein
VASLIIYKVRDELLDQAWNSELEIITKISKNEMLSLLDKSKKQFVWTEPVDEAKVVDLTLKSIKKRQNLSGVKLKKLTLVNEHKI